MSVQLGLLDASTAPMLDVEQARALSDPTFPLDHLIDRWQQRRR